MKSKRLVLYLAPFACIGFCLIAVRSFVEEIPRAISSGEQLSIAALARNEQVIVSRLFSHRTTTAREYHFGIDADPSRVRVWSMSVDWPGGTLRTSPEKILAERTLKKSEAEGLDEVVSYFRQVREEHSSAEQHYRLTYLRDGNKIGEEFYIGFSLPSTLAFYFKQGYRGDPGYDSDYSRLAQESGLTRARLDRMFAFEMLEGETALNNAVDVRP